MTLLLKDYDQEGDRQNYLQSEEDYYNSDDGSENEYEMSQNTPETFTYEGNQSRSYGDENLSLGDVRNYCEYLFHLK